MNNDVSITTISRGIEFDTREMIGEIMEAIPKSHPHYQDTQM